MGLVAFCQKGLIALLFLGLVAFLKGLIARNNKGLVAFCQKGIMPNANKIPIIVFSFTHLRYSDMVYFLNINGTCCLFAFHYYSSFLLSMPKGTMQIRSYTDNSLLDLSSMYYISLLLFIFTLYTLGR
jgi:hypothetical protein